MAGFSRGFGGDMGESFGQRRPPLYEVIKNILREYPSGQIFKVSPLESILMSQYRSIYIYMPNFH